MAGRTSVATRRLAARPVRSPPPGRTPRPPPAAMTRDGLPARPQCLHRRSAPCRRRSAARARTSLRAAAQPRSPCCGSAGRDQLQRCLVCLRPQRLHCASSAWRRVLRRAGRQALLRARGARLDSGRPHACSARRTAQRRSCRRCPGCRRRPGRHCSGACAGQQSGGASSLGHRSLSATACRGHRVGRPPPTTCTSEVCKNVLGTPWLFGDR